MSIMYAAIGFGNLCMNQLDSNLTKGKFICFDGIYILIDLYKCGNVVICRSVQQYLNCVYVTVLFYIKFYRASKKLVQKCLCLFNCTSI